MNTICGMSASPSYAAPAPRLRVMRPASCRRSWHDRRHGRAGREHRLMEITPAPTFDEDAEPPARQRLADWNARAGAAVIDFFVRLGIAAVCVAIGALLYLVGDQAGEIGIGIGLGIGLVLTTFVYAPVMMARTNGQTVGHRATDTRVVMADGSRMSGGRAFLREALVKGIVIETIGSLTFYILPIVNYLFPLWDANNETLHDKMCGTRVVTA
jgi:uncharacterized RDD family membrane protein YckC